MKTNQKSFFVDGRNCWKRTRASRVAFLIDGDAYFRAFKEAALKAQRSIFILSWDIDSRVLLRHEEDGSGFPNRLGDFLSALLERRPDLHIYILNWDFSVVYAFEREGSVLELLTFNFRKLDNSSNLSFKISHLSTRPIFCPAF